MKKSKNKKKLKMIEVEGETPDAEERMERACAMIADMLLKRYEEEHGVTKLKKRG